MRKFLAPFAATLALARAALALGALALGVPALGVPAHAETLLDNVDGVTLDRQGNLARFSGLVIAADGRITQVLQRKDKRPKRTDYVIDGKGRFVIPGLIDAHIRLMDLALAALTAERGPPADGQALPPPRAEDRDVALGKVQRRLAEQGITAVTDMGTTIEDWQTYRRAGDTGTLHLRIMAYAEDIRAMALIAGPRPTPWLYDDHLRLDGLHLTLDGPFEAREAALKAPYADAPAVKGPMLYNDTQLRNVMSRAAMDGFQLAISAHGDAAVAGTLGAFAELSATYGPARRWRIEGAQLADPADFTAYAVQGVIASFTPARLGDERRVAEARLGAARAAMVQPWRSVAQTGVQLTFGSGGGKHAQSPFAAMATAISREDGEGLPLGGWQSQERIDRVDALAAMTSVAAFAGFAEGRFGRLVAGERADFVLLDRDPLLIPPSELRTIRVLETWVGGRKIYDAMQTATQAVSGPGQLLRLPVGEAAPVLRQVDSPAPPVSR